MSPSHPKPLSLDTILCSHTMIHLSNPKSSILNSHPRHSVFTPCSHTTPNLPSHPAIPLSHLNPPVPSLMPQLSQIPFLGHGSTFASLWLLGSVPCLSFPVGRGLYGLHGLFTATATSRDPNLSTWVKSAYDHTEGKGVAGTWVPWEATKRCLSLQSDHPRAATKYADAIKWI